MATSIFISHSWKHKQDRNDLITLFSRRRYFCFETEEVCQHDPINSRNSEYIKQRLRTKIRSSKVVLAMAGMYASYSEWMEFEMNFAYRNNISILGIAPRGQERVSSIVQNYAVKILRWDTETIINAIRGVK